MKILTFSPLEMPYTKDARYTGLEKLAVQFSSKWAELGHSVTILAHKDTMTSLPLLECDGYINNDRTIHAEQTAFQQYQGLFREFDVIWDIGHLHLIARFMPGMPVLSVLNHAPEHAQYPKAPYNIISWSKWGVFAFKKYYKQVARYQETIMIDPEVYKPGTEKRNNRWLTLGRMAQEKGNLNAVMLCDRFNMELDVVGGRGSEAGINDPATVYEKAIMDRCDGERIKFHGEIDDGSKINLMQSGKGLIYMTQHTEITSHKVQEALMCGMPVIIPNLGGLPEIVTPGVDGFLCQDEADYILSVNTIQQLDPSKTREALTHKYHPDTVGQGYIELFQKVIDGERW